MKVFFIIFVCVAFAPLSHAQTRSVTSFDLINADNDQDILTFSNASNTVVNLATLSTRNLNIRATTNPAIVGSVKLALSGPQSRAQTESTSPYALYGDDKGNYYGATFALGRYTLKATPYSAANGGGSAGTALTITFDVVNQAPSNLLPTANAGADQVIYLPATSTSLSGSGQDPDGTISSYAWSQVGGPNDASFSSKTVAAPTVSGLTEGSYVFSLTVKDNQNAASPADQMTVTVLGQALPPVISGELKKWHKVTITFTGPATAENDAKNPFLDYRLIVTFSQGSQQFAVPGYYAADGNAGETGAAAGNKWRVHFAPNQTGTWTYSVSFRTGAGIAVNTAANAGSGIAFDGATGNFDIGASDKTGPDFRAKGRLRYTGQHYLQFEGTGTYFLKGGADSPENFMAYKDFDGTYSQGTDYTKTYAPHVGDWTSGDPTWMGGKGKGIIGAINYLAGKGMNSVYFLTMNVNGDGKDVWTWTSPTERYRFDVSKLDQWEVVFSHMDKLGLMMHVVTQETENDQLLDGGALGVQRQLYYRELIARFGHHLAICWNLGEENTNTDAQRKAFADYFKQQDPYKSFIAIHTYPGDQAAVYTPLLGYPSLDGASLQSGSISGVHQETLKWLSQSAAKGHKWVVNLDEIGPANDGVLPDANDYEHDQVRKKALWGNLMAGGGGSEWYFGYNYPNSDLTAQDWRSRDHMWDLTRYALQFFNQYLPYWNMKNDNALTSSITDYCLSLAGEAYAIYLPDGGTTTLNVGTATSTYNIKWYNPRTGGALQNGSIAQISGSGNKAVGYPPAENTKDWVCLVTKATAPKASGPGGGTGGLIADGIYPAYQTNPGEYAALQVSVYPNPFRDQVRIQLDLPEAQPLEIAITDLYGRTLYSQSATGVKRYAKELDMYQMKPGVYLLQVKCANGNFKKRIIKY